ncbi:MAG: thioredoxin [Candidatus Diapherotrites archaeon]|uniref:Thioredoxin n=1 Tax=Candidatus Iainarchaeum sp. TaxID=3101447 RepID=A0A7J4IUH9_9ARCH|nr:MAG: thioredoxin 1 [archaeon GW2011_AR10]MBS3058823.1 thioredoxin [Candidatus Diapherotrites archaeon]HIH08444.1 thioredoxin [Candidatus Diapherotrites archaeon]
MGEAEALTTTNFEKKVKAEKAVVVDFWAEWCGPCIAMAPIVEETAKEMNGKVKIAKLNVDENHEIAEKYGIRSIPTFLVFKAGKLVDQFAGATSKQEFKNKVKEYA